MDSLKFFIHLNFICDILRSLFSSKPKAAEEEVKEFTDIRDAIEYFGTDPSGLLKEIMSSDISLLEITVAEKNIAEYKKTLRSVTGHLARQDIRGTYIEGAKHTVYLRSFLIDGSDNDLHSSIESFYTLAKNFLINFERIKTSDVKYRLYGSISANLINLKQILAGIEFKED